MQENWMLYGATGHTGSLIATRAVECGYRPVLGGRSAPAVSALAERLGLPSCVVDLSDPVAMEVALGGMDLVLNAAGPFLHTAAPLAKACLRAGAHYLDISNELQVFLALYDLRPSEVVSVSFPVSDSASLPPTAWRALSARWSAAPITSRWPPGSHQPNRAPAPR